MALLDERDPAVCLFAAWRSATWSQRHKRMYAGATTQALLGELYVVSNFCKGIEMFTVPARQRLTASRKGSGAEAGFGFPYTHRQ